MVDTLAGMAVETIADASVAGPNGMVEDDDTHYFEPALCTQHHEMAAVEAVVGIEDEAPCNVVVTRTFDSGIAAAE